MPSSIVQDYLLELRDLPVPWIVQVAELAAWSIDATYDDVDGNRGQSRLLQIPLLLKAGGSCK